MTLSGPGNERMHNPPDRFSRYHILAISLLIFAVFYRVIGHGLVNIDDPLYVKNLYVVQGLTLDGLRFAFQLEDSLFGPLNWLSYMLDVEIFGGNPAGFHFTNLLLHLLNTILFYSILVRMTGARRTALFAAMLFAVHPLRVETVAWVSDRKDLLAMLFALLSMECYRQYTLQRTVWKYGLTGFFYILTLLSKPVLVTLPCTFLLLDLWPFRRLGGEGDAVRELFKEFGRLFVEKIPLFLISLIFTWLTYDSLKEAGLMIADQALPMGVRWANAAVTYMKYLGHVIWPSGFIVMYPQVKAQAPLWQVAGSYATLLAVSVGAILQYRRRPYLLVGWFWFVGNLVPLIGLLRAWPQEMADRYTYFPLIGLILAAAWGMRELARSGRVAFRVPVAVSAMVISPWRRYPGFKWEYGKTVSPYSSTPTGSARTTPSSTTTWDMS